MLLALWFDFWNPADWTPSTSISTPPVVVVGTGAGSGYSYEPAPPGYWDEREKFLRNHLPIRKESVDETPKIKRIVERHDRTLDIATRLHVTGARLVNIGKMLSDLESQFAAALLQRDEDELLEIILLLGV